MAQVLVLGATGRIGRALRLIWGHRGDILWQGRSQTEARPGWVKWAPGDSLPAARSLIVLAGVTKGTASDLAQNAQIASAAVQAAEQAGFERVFLSSSVAVYGETPDTGASENAPCAPFGAYGRAKLDMEAAAGKVARRVRVSALRIGNVVGADMLGQLCQRQDSQDPVLLDRFADGAGPVRSYIGPCRLASVLDTLLTRPDDPPEVLNVACPVPVTMESLLRHAGIAFQWAPASASARQKITMDCGLMQRLCALPSDCGKPDVLAREWLALRRVMA
jgi:nucleoside-diphosphate-sugar epimerase